MKTAFNKGKAFVFLAFWLAALMFTQSDGNAADQKAFYFPPSKGDWERVEPASVGWDAAKLNAALDFAGTRQSSGVVILHRGKIMAEKYWNPEGGPTKAKAKMRDYARVVRGKDADGHAIEDVASVQKSVSAMLMGIAQHKGLLSIDDAVSKHLGAGWSKASPEQEQAITVKHLLTMTSGLLDDLTFEAPAGTKWRYNTGAYSRTVQVIAAASKTKPNEFTREWLTGKIGMNDSQWSARGDGQEAVVNALGFATTARDLARFGLMIEAGGKWKDETIIADQAYLKAALTPSQKLNPSYGYLWWLNGQAEVARGAGAKVKGPLIPSAPADLVAALGAVDRKIFVVPSLDLVVTRLGSVAGANFDNELWKLIMAATPGKK